MTTTVHSTPAPGRTITVEEVGDVPELAIYPGLTLPWERVVVERHNGKYVRNHGAEFTTRTAHAGGVEAVARAVEVALTSRADTTPEQEPDAAGLVLTVLAAARVEGLSLECGMLAALIAARHHLTPAKAVDLARFAAWDERVKDAGDERDQLFEEARLAAQAAEYGETPATVTA